MTEVIYKHYRKKDENYIILDLIYLQNPQGEWEEAILYKSLSSNKKFVRSEVEWDSKFRVV